MTRASFRYWPRFDSSDHHAVFRRPPRKSYHPVRLILGFKLQTLMARRYEANRPSNQRPCKLNSRKSRQ